MAVSIGWFGSDLVDEAGDAISSGWDAVVDTVPGAREVVDVVDSVLVGPVRDFAQSGVGRAMLTALATSVTGGLAPVLGPQLATVAFAIPGVAAGDDFITAWTQEFGSRVKQTAEIMGADVVPATWGDQLSKAADYLNKYDIPWNTIDFHTLAKWAGVREDVAAWLVAGATNDMTDYMRHVFDPKTGKDMGIGESPLEYARRIADQIVRHALEVQARQQAQFRARLSQPVGSFGASLRTNLFPGQTSTPATPPALLPSPVVGVRAVAGPASSPNRVAGDVMLGVVLVAAAGALVYHFTR